MSAPLLALYAEWATATGGIEGRVEAGENGWFWCTPIDRERSVAAVFVDPKRLSGAAREDIATSYRELLTRFRLFHAAGHRRMIGRVGACDASSRYAEVAAASDFVRVGDACLSLDPLSSQGVQTAVASALQAAIVANTLLRRPADAEAAIQFYRDAQRERRRQHAAKTAGFYRERTAVCDQPFWHQRATFDESANAFELETDRLVPTVRVRVSGLARTESVPVIQGDFIKTRRALTHPALERPVAFLNEVELVPLLRQIKLGQTAGSVVEAWSANLSFDLGWRVLNWLWHRRIAVPLNSAPERAK